MPNVPARPSTPSEQLNELTEIAKINVAMGMKLHAERVKVFVVNGSQMSFAPALWSAAAAIRQHIVSRMNFFNCPHGFVARSSRYPKSIIRYSIAITMKIFISSGITRSNIGSIVRAIIIPAPVGFPFESSPPGVSALPWSWGSLFQNLGSVIHVAMAEIKAPIDSNTRCDEKSRSGVLLKVVPRRCSMADCRW